MGRLSGQGTGVPIAESMIAETPIYLDYNATTPVLPEVVDAMLPYLREHFGNPSSGHVYGRRANDAVAHARHEVARLLGCEDDEIIFTFGAPRPITWPSEA